MMGDTGPCGPCSEIHVDLTPAGDTGGALVNKGSAACIEIWNLVFIQFNANPDGTFSPLPAKHVDTGMGFERVTSIIQGTQGFTDFANARISNYETDMFRPIFDAIERLSGRRYGSTLPVAGLYREIPSRKRLMWRFRVIADHIRTLVLCGGRRHPAWKHGSELRVAADFAARGSLWAHVGIQGAVLFQAGGGAGGTTMGEVFPEIRAGRIR
jgi:alanyl-tRNA synthetase